MADSWPFASRAGFKRPTLSLYFHRAAICYNSALNRKAVDKKWSQKCTTPCVSFAQYASFVRARLLAERRCRVVVSTHAHRTVRGACEVFLLVFVPPILCRYILLQYTHTS